MTTLLALTTLSDTTLLDLAGALVAAIAAGAVGTWVVREVRRDGMGFRQAPRGSDDWSALGLPSRPYGA